MVQRYCSLCEKVTEHHLHFGMLYCKHCNSHKALNPKINSSLNHGYRIKVRGVRI